MTNKNLVNSLDNLACMLRQKDKERAQARLFYRAAKSISRKAVIATGVIVAYFMAITSVAVVVLRYMYSR